MVLVVLDGWGLAPPGPGQRGRAGRRPRCSTGSWAEYPHTTLEASGEAVGLPPGQMGNSRGRPPDARLRARAPPGSACGSTGRSRTARSSRTRRSPAPPCGPGGAEAACICSDSSPTAASTRTCTTSRPCSSSRGGTGSLTGRGSTRSRTAATSRRMRPCAIWPTCPRSAIATVVGPLLRDGPRRPLGAHRPRATRPSSRARARPPTDAIDAVQASYDRGVTDEFVEPIVLDRQAPCSAPTTTAIFFNFRPDRAPAAVPAPARARLPADDDDALPRRLRLPRRVRGAGRLRDAWPRCCAEHGVRQLHAAETEKYAHVTYFFNGGREEEWAGEDADPRSDRRATCRATTTQPRMSADEVTDARRARSSTTATGSALVNSRRTRTWSATRVSIPAVVRGRRGGRRVPRPHRRAGAVSSAASAS